MATTLTPPQPGTARGLEDAGHGGGGFYPGGFGGGGGFPEYRVPARTYRLGMWFALTGIVMFFAAFTSALVVRKGMSFDWAAIAVPRVLWLNTGVLILSSITLELARRSLTVGAAARFIRWLCATVALGLGFLGGQLVAWGELASRGVYLATNPSSSFFYLLTAAHGVHLLGGIIALAYGVWRAGRVAHGPDSSGTVMDVTAIYWHFMDVLWIYIFFLIMRLM
jgi:cytochrome c oxidase subunit 3